MKISKYIVLSFFLFLISLVEVYAVDAAPSDRVPAHSTTPAATSSNSTSDAQSDQMLQQIKQLQAKQQQQLAAEQGTAPTTQTANVQTPTVTQAQSSYNSSFEYPFANAQIPQTQTERQIGQSAFAGAVTQVLPMNPRQIHRLKQIYDASQFAAAAPAGTPPQPTATSMYVNLSPGASPPAIRLSQGFVTSVVFLDSTGAAWPVDAYDLGNPTAFDIAWDKTDNVLMIQAKTLYTYGNLAVRLRGLNTPIMLTLIPGQQVIDYRVDMTVPGFGPNAKAMSINTGLPPQATPILLDVLDGIPPQGSKQLEMSDTVGEAWFLDGKMYIRTQYTLLSPGWLATMASADGTNAYKVQKTPMLLMAKNGKIINVKIGGL